MSACADTPRARNHTREPAHTMPITSALSVRGEPDWASMQQTIEMRLVHRRWYRAHLVELICLLPVTTCQKRSGSGGTSSKLSSLHDHCGGDIPSNHDHVVHIAHLICITHRAGFAERPSGPQYVFSAHPCYRPIEHG